MLGVFVKPPSSDNTPYEKIGDEVRSLAEEVPFDIPDSWEWVRIRSLGEIVRGSGIKRNETVQQGLPCVRYGELYTTYQTSFTSAVSFIPPDLYKKCKHFSYGDVLMTLTGENKPDIAKAVAYLGTEPIAAGGDLAFWTRHGMNPLFLAYIMASPYIIGRKVALATGDIIVHISGDKLGTILLPVPPLAEQERIVARIREAELVIENYALKATALQKLQDSFPEALKKSILQEVVQGKLVPQDPSDEPAEALLERIRAEKQRLIKEGKIKKDKHESVIFRRDNSHYEKRGSEEVCIDDEIPFEIPENWAWCRASSLGTMIRGRGIKRTETVAQGFPCIRYGEIYTTYETSFDSAVSFVPETLDKDCLHFSSGDVVFTLTGENKVDIAKTVAFLGDGQIAAGGDLAFWTHHGMNPLYLVYYMASPYCIELKRRTATGDIIVHISTSKVGDFLVPVPPTNEQNRIVSAIEQLFAVASTL